MTGLPPTPEEVDAFLNGHVSTFDFEFVGGFLGGDWSVIKLSFEHRAGWRAFQLDKGGWSRILLRFRTDWATPFSDHALPWRRQSSPISRVSP